MPLPEVCVVFVMRAGADGLEVLLGDRLTGPGRGRIVGVGGALNRGEPARDAAVRGLLDEAGVAMLAGTAFGEHGEGYMRVSYANSQANLREALELTADLLATR